MTEENPAVSIRAEERASVTLPSAANVADSAARMEMTLPGVTATAIPEELIPEVQGDAAPTQERKTVLGKIGRFLKKFGK